MAHKKETITYTYSNLPVIFHYFLSTCKYIGLNVVDCSLNWHQRYRNSKLYDADTEFSRFDICAPKSEMTSSIVLNDGEWYRKLFINWYDKPHYADDDIHLAIINEENLLEVITYMCKVMNYVPKKKIVVQKEIFSITESIIDKKVKRSWKYDKNWVHARNWKLRPYGITFRNGYDGEDNKNIRVNKCIERAKNRNIDIINVDGQYFLPEDYNQITEEIERRNWYDELEAAEYEDYYNQLYEEACDRERNERNRLKMNSTEE